MNSQLGNMYRTLHDLPYDLDITKHARERIKERFAALTEIKLKKAVVKAWLSKETSKKMQELIARKTPDTIHRLFNGIIWVFVNDDPSMPKPKTRLVTVILPGQL